MKFTYDYKRGVIKKLIIYIEIGSPKSIEPS
jgi:hypothetical protein